jgi:glycosyltransferase involved in cell wall biosynthesis
MLIFRTGDVNEQMRRTLRPNVSIYEAEWVLDYGCDEFLDGARCSVIHSHGVISEIFFFGQCDAQVDVPYIATLHGSYESSSPEHLPEADIAKFVRRVDHFVYTADKNLGPLLRNDAPPQKLSKMANAMPVDPAPFPLSRGQLGIPETAVVFTFVARGIREKGWEPAIEAFKMIQADAPETPMHLLLVGEGEETDRLASIHGTDPAMTFLGYQLRIHGLYRLSDVAIVPTRFAGESFPLCIIQALQVGVPVAATDIGEIASMLDRDGVRGGVLVQRSDDDEEFTARFAKSMRTLLDGKRRLELSRGARILGERYDMVALTDHYLDLYGRVAAAHTMQ